MEDLLSGRRRRGEGPVQAGLARGGEYGLDVLGPVAVREPDELDEHLGDRRCQLTELGGLLPCQLVPVGGGERLLVGLFDPDRVSFDQSGEGKRRLVVAAVELGTVEREVLVLKGVGQLVGERAAHQWGGLGAADQEHLVLLVVEADDRARVQRPHRLAEVDVRSDEPQGAEHLLGLLDARGARRGELLGPLLERGVVEQRYRDAPLELQPARALHEPLQPADEGRQGGRHRRGRGGGGGLAGRGRLETDAGPGHPHAAGGAGAAGHADEQGGHAGGQH